MIRRIAQLLGLVEGEHEVEDEHKAAIRVTLDEAHDEVEASRSARQRALQYQVDLHRRHR